MVKCCLLTGATGLLGRYLLHDLTIAGVPLAVLVRRGRLQSARDRVEAILAAWECRRGHMLPRPMVFEGGLDRENCGLDASSRRWLAEHCSTVLHSAASMSFVADADSGEPRRTNVDGLARLLECCRGAGIRRFHHVSTAYVCGLREGRVLETELDEGQTLGNVYEESKVAAEKMLRNADFLDGLTIYRPGSIVGDSRTGETTNYHGFYLPLQLAHALAGTIPPEVMDERFSALLGLSGREGKNLVPVDWVSAAITHIVTHPQHHGRVYHLTNPRPTTVGMIQKVIQEAIRRCSKRPTANRVDPAEMATYERLFQGQMSIYRSHWRDDPLFDRSNADAALADLPCPEIDHACLLRLASYAVEANFNQRRYESVARDFDVGQRLESLLGAAGAGGDKLADASVGLHVTGPGGGVWRLLLRGGALVGAEAAPSEGAACRINAQTFASLARGLATVRQSIDRGQIVIEGPTDVQPQVIRALQQATAATARSLSSQQNPR